MRTEFIGVKKKLRVLVHLGVISSVDKGLRCVQGKVFFFLVTSWRAIDSSKLCSETDYLSNQRLNVLLYCG